MSDMTDEQPPPTGGRSGRRSGGRAARQAARSKTSTETQPSYPISSSAPRIGTKSVSPIPGPSRFVSLTWK